MNDEKDNLEALSKRFGIALPKEDKTTSPIKKLGGYSPLTRTTGDKEKDSLYEQWGKQYDIDPNLLFEQGFQESKFKTNAKSKKGALGPAQFMPDTAREFGMRVDNQVDERLDWTKAVPAQAKLMRKLLDRTGDIPLALAGYNSGHNYSVEQLRRNLVNIAETRDYANKIMSAYSGKGSQAEAMQDDILDALSNKFLGGTTQPDNINNLSNQFLGGNVQPQPTQPTVQQPIQPQPLQQPIVAGNSGAGIPIPPIPQTPKIPFVPGQLRTPADPNFTQQIERARQSTINDEKRFNVGPVIQTEDGKTLRFVRKGERDGEVVFRDIANPKGGEITLIDKGKGQYQLPKSMQPTQPNGKPQPIPQKPTGKQPMTKGKPGGIPDEIPLADGRKLKKAENQENLKEGNYRFVDDNGDSWIADPANKKVYEEAANDIVENIPVKLVPKEQRNSVDPQTAKQLYINQVADYLSKKYDGTMTVENPNGMQIRYEDVKPWMEKKGLISKADNKELTDDKYYSNGLDSERVSMPGQAGITNQHPESATGTSIQDFNNPINATRDYQSTTHAFTKRELRDLADFSFAEKNKLENTALGMLSAKGEFSPDDIRYFEEQGLDIQKLQKDRYEDYQLALTKGQVNQQKFLQRREEIYQKEGDKYIADLKAKKETGILPGKIAQAEIDKYNELKESKRQEFEAQNVQGGQNDFQNLNLARIGNPNMPVYTPSQTDAKVNQYMQQMLEMYGSATNREKKIKDEEMANAIAANRVANMTWGEYLGEMGKTIPANIVRSALETSISGTWRGIALASNFLDDNVLNLSGKNKNVEDYETYKIAENFSKILRDYTPINEDLVNSGGITGFIAGDFSQGFGSSIGMAAGGYAKYSKTAIAFLSSLQMGGDAYREARELGISPEKAQIAAMYQLPLGATEIFGMGKILERLNTGKGATVWRKLFADAWNNAVTEVPEEIFQEGFQTVTQNIIQNKIYDPDKKWSDGAFNAMAAAGFSAGVSTAGVSILNHIRLRNVYNQLIKKEEANGVIIQHYGDNEAYAFGQKIPVNNQTASLLKSFDNARNGIEEVQAEIESVKEKALNDIKKLKLVSLNQADVSQIRAIQKEAVEKLTDLRNELNQLQNRQGVISKEIVEKAGIEVPQETIGETVVNNIEPGNNEQPQPQSKPIQNLKPSIPVIRKQENETPGETVPTQEPAPIEQPTIETKPDEYAPQQKQEFEHTDFGRVTESDNQSGVPKDKIRVEDTNGKFHVIQKPKKTGAGNQKAIPVRVQGLRFDDGQQNEGKNQPQTDLQSNKETQENQQVTQKSEEKTGLQSNKKGEIGEIFDGFTGENMTRDLRNKLWSWAIEGKTTENGTPSNVLHIAKVIREKGGLQTQEEFDNFLNDYYDNLGEKKGEDIRPLANELYAKYTKNAEEKPSVPSIQKSSAKRFEVVGDKDGESNVLISASDDAETAKNAEKWAKENGFQNIRMSDLENLEKPDFSKTVNNLEGSAGKSDTKSEKPSVPEVSKKKTENKNALSEDDYVKQGLANLRTTSRTAAGVVDTSASKGKADQITEGLTGEDAARMAVENFERALRFLFQKRNQNFSAEDINNISQEVNKDIVKDDVLFRTEDSDKYPYTRIKDLPAAYEQFIKELNERLNDSKADPIETAAWIEWRLNLTDHFFADGVGKTTKLISAIPLMKAGLSLPVHIHKNEFFGFTNRDKIYSPKENNYLDENYQKFLEYYRTLFDGKKVAIPTFIEHSGTRADISPLPLTGRLANLQDKTIREVIADPQKWIDRYLNEISTKEINSDEAKKLFDEYKDDPLANVQGVHEASSIISWLTFNHQLKEFESKGKSAQVLLTAGGAGSGKTFSTKKLLEAADIVYDSVMKSADSNRELIDAIVDKGHSPLVVFVYRNLEEAAKAGIKRWRDEKRIVPIKVFANGHFNSIKTFIEDTYDYALSKGGNVRIYDNQENVNPSPVITIDELKEKAYTDIEGVENRVRQASYKEYESDSEKYFDGRIPIALEGGNVEYKPGYNNLGRTDSERDRRESSAGTPGRERSGKQTLTNDERSTTNSRSSEDSGTSNDSVSGSDSTQLLEEELPKSDEGTRERGGKSSSDSPGSVLSDVQQPDRRRSESDGGETDSNGGSDLSTDGGSGSNLDNKSTKPGKPQGDGKRVVGTTGNYYVDDVEGFTKGGLKSKFYANVEALKTLRQIQLEGRTTATPEEQKILAKYIGWGQFPALFNTYNEKGKEWEKEREILLSLISQEEFDSASGSTKNAHYTAPQVVKTVWNIVQKLGFKGGKVIETSLGTGNFLMLMPPELRGTSRVTGIEFDSLTAQIAKLLFPSYDIREQGYETFSPPKGFYDLAISNVPFGNYKVADPGMPYFLKSQIHNYFFAKSLENVRPGGLIAFITSTGTMSAPDVLNYLKGKADLVTSVRFPANTFLKDAGTAVVTDLVVLRVKDEFAPARLEKEREQLKETKKFYEDQIKTYEEEVKQNPSDELKVKLSRMELGLASVNQSLEDIDDALKTHRMFDDNNWTNLTTLPDPAGGEDIPINEYYAKNPQNMLGTLDRTGTMYQGNSINLSRTPDFEQRLEKYIKSLPNNVMFERTVEEAMSVNLLAAPDSMRQGSLTVKDGKVYSREGSFLKEVPTTIKNIANIEAILKVRDLLNEVANLERVGNIREAEKNRLELNKAYDEYVAKYGTIHDNRKLIETDPDHYRLLSLEVFDKKTKKVTGKADIFREPTISYAEKATSAENYGDALNIVLNQTGIIDIEEIAKLMGEDSETVEEELSKQGLAFHDPRDGWIVKDLYLSGEVRRKLREAIEAAKVEPRYQHNIDALEKVQPEDIPYRKIKPTLGAAWIPASDIKQFMADMFTDAGENASPDDFIVEKIGTGDWIIGFKNHSLATSRVSTQILGTSDRSFADTVSASIKDMPIVIWRTSDGVKSMDKRASLRANNKVKDVRRKFEKWVWKDDERRMRLHRAYNDTYNDVVKTKWDGSHLTFPGMLKSWANQVRPHIKNAVYRLLIQGKLLAAHEVGTGKTNLMIAGAMELRRLKLAKKPAIVCLNANVEQVAEAARELYPGAKILAAYSGMDAKTRKETATRIMSGDWDIVILTHDNLLKIPMSKARQVAFIQEEIAYLRDQVRAAEAIAEEEESGNSYGWGRRRGKSKNSDNRVVKALEAKIASRVAKYNELFAKPKDDAITFEETGIDFLLVDEAHAFKNLDIATTREGTKGIPTSDAQRATNMFMVSRYLMETNNNRGMAFFTGTPISNTTAEAFNIQRYLQYAELKARGIEKFDAWAANYGENISTQEMSATGDYKYVTAFRGFKNLETLVGLIHQVMDVVWAADVGQIKRPKRIDRVIKSPMSDAQIEFQRSLVARAEALKKMTRQERKQKGADNWLAIGMHAKWAAIDMRLVDPEAEDDPNSKTNKLVQEVLQIQKDNPGKTQLIFSDVGVNPNKINPKFSLYKDIIDKLVAGGIPRNKIIDFTKFKSSSSKNENDDDGESPQKEAAMRRLQEGDAWIALGSSQKLGTGVNVQDLVVAMHKLDVKQRPDQDEQETGRGHRHGNKNEEVQLIRYTTEDSFDQFFYDRLKQKKGFIDDILRGTASGEYVDSIDDSLDYDTVVAMTSSNPLIKERLDVLRELHGLENEFEGFEEDQLRLRDSLLRAKNAIKEDERDIADIEEDREKAIAESDNRKITIFDQNFEIESRSEINAYENKVQEITFNTRKEYEEANPIKRISESKFNKLSPEEKESYMEELDKLEKEQSKQIRKLIKERIDEIPVPEFVKANESYAAKINEYRKRFKTDRWGFGSRLLREGREGGTDFGKVFGFPLHVEFAETEKGDALSVSAYLNLPSGRRVKLQTLTNIVNEAAIQLNTIRTRDTEWQRQRVERNKADIPRLEKQLGEEFEQKELLDTLRKKLARIESELGGNIIPEGFQLPDERVTDLTTVQTKEDSDEKFTELGNKKREWQIGAVGEVGKYVASKSLILRGENLPETTNVATDTANNSTLRLFNQAKDVLKGNPKEFVPVVVDLEPDIVYFNNNKGMPSADYAYIKSAYPDAYFIADENKIYAVHNNQIVAIVGAMSTPGALTEDLMPAIRRATYSAEIAKERRERVSKLFSKAIEKQNILKATKSFVNLITGTTSQFDEDNFDYAQPFGLKAIEENATGPEFYSAVERTIENAKQEKFSVDQVKALFKTPGIKQEELEWLDIDSFLDGKQKISKSDLLDYIRANSVEIQEVMKGNPTMTSAESARFNELLGFGRDRNLTVAEREEFKNLQEISNQYQETSFSQYTLPGGENYKELLLVLPTKDSPEPIITERKDGLFDVLLPDGTPFAGGYTFESAQIVAHEMMNFPGKYSADKTNYKSQHWDEKNVLAHIRFDERTDSEGRRTLHIAEIQSDWHQAGRKKGYSSQSEIKNLESQLQKAKSNLDDIFNNSSRNWDDTSDIDAAREEIKKIESQLQTLKSESVPDAPFKKSWQELAFKKMLRYAVENGFDAISWDTGETNADRYDLSTSVNSIVAQRRGNRLPVLVNAGQSTFEIVYDVKTDKVVSGPEQVLGKPLDEVIGKDLAEKIINQENGEKVTYSDDKLKIGGEGMVGFYDKILPAFVKKYIKKWGATVGQSSVNTSANGELARSIEQLEDGRWVVNKWQNNSYQPIETFDTKTEALNFGRTLLNTEIHSVEITPAMRESVLSGQPLFAMSEAEKREQFQAVKTKPTSEIAYKAEVTRNGSAVHLNIEAEEILRRAAEEADIRKGRKKIGDKSVEASFSGQFYDRAMTKETINTLRTVAKEAKAAGYVKGAEAISKIADELEAAQKEGQGTFVAYVFDKRLPHEYFHQASYLGDVLRDLRSRHTKVKELDSHKVTQATADYLLEFDEYRRMKKANSELFKAVVREEAAAYIAGGELFEGISEDEAADFMNLWFDSYIEKNGIESLKNFEVIEGYVQEIIQQIKNSFAQNENSQQNGSTSSSGGKSGQNTGGTQGSNESSSGENSQPKTKGENSMGGESRRLPAGTESAEVNPDTKLRRLPANLRMNEIDAEDSWYEVQHDTDAKAEASKMLQDLGLQGAVDLLTNIKNPDASHAQLAFMVAQTLSNNAARFEEEGDLESAKIVREEQAKFTKNLAVQYTKAGQFISAARVIANSPTGLVMSAQAIIESMHGKDRTLSPEQIQKYEDLGKKLNKAVNDLNEANKNLRNEKAKNKRLQDKLDGKTPARRSTRSGKARTKLVELVREEKGKEVASLLNDLRKELGLDLGLKAVEERNILKEIEDQATNPIDPDTLQKIAKVGALTLIDKINAKDDEVYIDDHFFADMISMLGESIRPHMDSIYYESMKMRDKWLKEVAEKTRREQLQNKFDDDEGKAELEALLGRKLGKDLTDEDIYEILDIERGIRKTRAAVEKFHLLSSGFKKSNLTDELTKTIIELAPTPEIAVAAKILADNPKVSQFYAKLDQAGIEVETVRKRVAEFWDNFRNSKSFADFKTSLEKLFAEDKTNKLFVQGKELLKQAKDKIVENNVEILQKVADQSTQLTNASSALWQKRQEQQQVAEEIANEFSKLKNGKVKHYAKATWEALMQVPNNLKATGEFSFLFRQGGRFITSEFLRLIVNSISGQFTQDGHNIKSDLSEQYENLSALFRSLKSAEGFGQTVMKVEDDPLFGEAESMGLQFSSAGKIGTGAKAGEEQLNSSIAESIPIYGALVKRFDESMAGTLDTLRMMMYRRMRESLVDAGFDPVQDKQEFIKIAKDVNRGTGKANKFENFKPAQDFVNFLNSSHLPFAANYTVSNWQKIGADVSNVGKAIGNIVILRGLPKGAQAEMLKRAAYSYSSMCLIYGLAGLALGAFVGLDPDDDDFLKFKWGNYRYDVSFGLKTELRFIGRLMKSIIRGNRVPNEQLYDFVTLPGRYVRGKLNVLPGFVIDAMTGSDITGKDFSLADWTRWANLFIPITYSNAISTGYQFGPQATLATLPLEFVGVGTAVYEDRPEQPETEAEKLALKIKRMKQPWFSPVSYKDKIDQLMWNEITKLKARSRKGEDVSGEVEKLQKSGKISERIANDILKAKGQTILQEFVEDARMGDSEIKALYNVANDREKADLKPIFEARFKAKDKKYEMTAEDRAELDKMGFDIPGDVPMPKSVESEMSRLKITKPDVSGSLTIVKGQGQVELTREQQNKYRSDILTNAYQNIEKLVNDKRYKAASDEDKEAMIRKEISIARKMAQNSIKAEIRPSIPMVKK